MKKKLTGKWALVTGSSRGIGRQIALGLARQNCNVILHGRIINLTSGIADQPNLAPDSVSKAAVDKYTRDLAFALKDDNVLVNYLDPGWLKTDMGGLDAWEEVDTVLPGALVPALLDDNGPTGKHYAAQDYKVLA